MPAKTRPERIADMEAKVAELDHELETNYSRVFAFGAGQLVFVGGEDDGSGWAGVFPDSSRPTTFLRFAARPSTPDGAPWYDIVELYVVDAHGLTGRDLRSLPLGQIEAAVNQKANAERMARFAKRTDGGLGISFTETTLASLAADKPRRGRAPRMQVRIPEGHKKPDSFYEQIAYRYGWLQGEGVKSPAEELAEANGVPTTTVHRWIKEARRRGIMSGGQRATRQDAP